MPSIRAYVSQNLFEKLDPKNREFLSYQWRWAVSGLPSLHVSLEEVEVLWIVFDDNSNAYKLTLDVVFSVGYGENEIPIANTTNCVNDLILALGTCLSETTLLPPGNYGVWPQPIPHARFATFTIK